MVKILSRRDPLETSTEVFCWRVCEAWGQEKEGKRGTSLFFVPHCWVC